MLRTRGLGFALHLLFLLRVFLLQLLGLLLVLLFQLLLACFIRLLAGLPLVLRPVSKSVGLRAAGRSHAAPRRPLNKLMTTMTMATTNIR